MIKAITRDEILHGLAEPYYCCMFGITKRAYHCDMWSTIFDKVGGIGYLARLDGKIVGQLIFLPKNYARRIGLPSSPDDTDLQRTLVVACLYVLKDYGNRGIGSSMIERTIDFCHKHGFTRLEACVDPRPPDQSGMSTSFYPFRKFGFVVDDPREGWEFRPEMRICMLELA